ncbi:MAG: rsmG [Desulfacinum sp.]|nr:rsmG [Desulfacinum sp.]
MTSDEGRVRGCEKELREICEAAGLSLGDREVALCCRHLALVFQWNRRMNLTRVREEEAVAKHLLDSLIPLPVLPPEGRVLDVGSGAGFPGVPLAVCRPRCGVTLLDASRKKTSFLKVAAAELGLSQVKVVHGRLEDFAQEVLKEHRFAGFDLITFRAVNPDPDLMGLLARLATAGSGCIAYWAGARSGARDAEEAARWEALGLERLEDFHYDLPADLGRRTLIRWRGK